MAEKGRTRRGKFPDMDAPDPKFKVTSLIRKIGEELQVTEALTRTHVLKIEQLNVQYEENYRPHKQKINKLLLEVFGLIEDQPQAFGLTEGKRVVELNSGVVVLEPDRFTILPTTVDTPVAESIKRLKRLRKKEARKDIPE